MCVYVCGRGGGKGEGRGREGIRVNGISLQCVQDQHENGPFTTPRIVYVRKPTQNCIQDYIY